MQRVGNNYSYLTESVVILIRWRVCISIKHETTVYGKIGNTQTCKCHPILQKDKQEIVDET